MGLMNAIECVVPDTKEANAVAAKAFIAECSKRKLILMGAGSLGNCVRFLPPLNISDEEMDIAFEHLHRGRRPSRSPEPSSQYAHPHGGGEFGLPAPVLHSRAMSDPSPQAPRFTHARPRPLRGDRRRRRRVPRQLPGVDGGGAHRPAPRAGSPHRRHRGARRRAAGGRRPRQVPAAGAPRRPRRDRPVGGRGRAGDLLVQVRDLPRRAAAGHGARPGTPCATGPRAAALRVPGWFKELFAGDPRGGRPREHAGLSRRQRCRRTSTRTCLPTSRCSTATGTTTVRPASRAPIAGGPSATSA